MQVSVALVPPEQVRTEIGALVDGVRGVDELDRVPTDALRLRLFELGNLTRPDVEALCQDLARQVRDLGLRPRIRLAGVWALESDTDPTIALRLDGDVDGVVALANALPPMVLAHGFFVDRRLFATRVPVARVTDSTSLKVLERLVSALEGYRSPEWDVASVDVLGRVRGGTAFDVIHSLSTTG